MQSQEIIKSYPSENHQILHILSITHDTVVQVPEYLALNPLIDVPVLHKLPKENPRWSLISSLSPISNSLDFTADILGNSLDASTAALTAVKLFATLNPYNNTYNTIVLLAAAIYNI
uniref:Uncharacterized protein n=1 Tax=Glossina pallidipes TaxID=7398 RepID=A0A1A9ZTL8_GLOPL